MIFPVLDSDMKKIPSPFIYKIIDGQEVALPNPEHEEYERKHKYDIFLKRSGIPTEYQKYTWDTIQGIPPKTLKYCKQYADTFSNGGEINLYIYGQRTAGKTTLACVIGMSILQQGIEVCFIKAHSIQNLMLKCQGYNQDESARDELDRYLSCEFLIIDDAFDRSKSVHWKNSPELIISEWNDFIRERVQQEKRLLFTSNIGIMSLREWGEDVYEMLSPNRGKFREITYDNSDLKLIRREKLDNSI